MTQGATLRVSQNNSIKFCKNTKKDDKRNLKFNISALDQSNSGGGDAQMKIV